MPNMILLSHFLQLFLPAFYSQIQTNQEMLARASGARALTKQKMTGKCRKLTKINLLIAARALGHFVAFVCMFLQRWEKSFGAPVLRDWPRLTSVQMRARAAFILQRKRLYRNFFFFSHSGRGISAVCAASRHHKVRENGGVRLLRTVSP